MHKIPDLTSVSVDVSRSDSGYECGKVNSIGQISGLTCLFYYGIDPETKADTPYAAIGPEIDGLLEFPFIFAPREHIVELARKIIELVDSEKDG